MMRKGIRKIGDKMVLKNRMIPRIPEMKYMAKETFADVLILNDDA
jgi:hypothetical protein